MSNTQSVKKQKKQQNALNMEGVGHKKLPFLAALAALHLPPKDKKWVSQMVIFRWGCIF